jgi:hypothetical protein
MRWSSTQATAFKTACGSSRADGSRTRLSPIALVGQTRKGRGTTQARRAIQSVPAVDAATAELIAVLIGAIRFFETLYAAAAVGGTQRTERRGAAFSIFVTLVANEPALVTPVLALAVDIFLAFLEAAIGERVASIPDVAVGRRHASDTAVTRGLATGKPRRRAIRVIRALRAQQVVAAMQISGTDCNVATANLLGATTTKIARACVTSRGRAATAQPGVTTATGRAIARGTAERCPCASGRTARSRDRHHVKKETVVAGRAAQSERQHGDER